MIDFWFQTTSMYSFSLGDQTRVIEERFRACEKVCVPKNYWRLDWLKYKKDCLRFVLYISNREGLEVTDDVSIVEYLKHPVFVTQGSYTNIKVIKH